MNRHSWLRCAVLGCAILGTCAAAAAEWGDLTGRFVVEGDLPPARIIEQAARLCGLPVVDDSVMVDQQNRLQNCFIYLRTKPPAVAPQYAATAKNNVILDLKNCYFAPHAVVLRTSQTLLFRNSETFNVNFMLDTDVNPPANRPVVRDSKFELRLRAPEALPSLASSNFQSWLRAWVLVRDDPYAAVSSADGTFTIRELPAGTELEFQLWHERAGYLRHVQTGIGAANARGRLTVFIKPGQNDLGDITVPATLLKPRAGP